MDGGEFLISEINKGLRVLRIMRMFGFTDMIQVLIDALGAGSFILI